MGLGFAVRGVRKGSSSSSEVMGVMGRSEPCELGLEYGLAVGVGDMDGLGFGIGFAFVFGWRLLLG